MAEPSWTVLVSATGELGAVASRADALQAIANAVKCDIGELDRREVRGMDRHQTPTAQLFAVYHRGEHVGEFWPDEEVSSG